MCSMVKRFIADGIMVRDLEGKIPTIMTHNKKQQETYLDSLNELAQDSKKYHKMTSVIDCDEIIYLSKGKIVERGTFDELMKLDGHFAGVYKTQMAKQTVA